MPTVAVTDTTFQSAVMDAPVPVLVDFWAEWCGPCKQIAPALERLSDKFAGRLVVAKVDVDHNPMIAQAMRIQSIPTMVLFKEGRPVDAVQGALPESNLEQFVEPHLAPPAPAGIAITVSALADALESGAPYTLVDVRAPIHFDRSHLRGAKNVEAGKLQAALPELAAAGNPIVLICRTGEESKALAEAEEEGPFSVMALEKGLLEWEGEGQPTFSTKEEARLPGGTS